MQACHSAAITATTVCPLSTRFEGSRRNPAHFSTVANIESCEGYEAIVSYPLIGYTDWQASKNVT